MSRTEQGVSRSVLGWEKFSDALREEDAKVFRRMLSEAAPIAKTLMSSGSIDSPDEALFMAILLRIRQLLDAKQHRLASEQQTLG
jgi:hypothetical protein